MFETALGIFFKELIDKFFSLFKPKRTGLDIYMDYHDKIEIILNELKGDFETSRIAVSLFHNGEYFLDKISKQYLSGFVEVTLNGTPKLIHQFQRIPVSYFSKVVNSMMKYGQLVAHDVDEELGHRDNELGLLMKAHGLIAYYTFPLYNRKGFMIGFLSLCSEDRKSILQEEDLEYIKFRCVQISEILNS